MTEAVGNDLHAIRIPTGKAALCLKFRIPPVDVSNAAENELQLESSQNQPKREACPKCHRQSHIFCYECCALTPSSLRWLPQPPIDLPLHLHILLHPHEHRSKSTALHAKVLCSQESVSVHTFPALPACVRAAPSETLLVYPSAHAKPMDALPDIASMKHIVFIEGTWRQSRAVARDPAVAALPNVVTLREYATVFWRFQSEGEGFLSTIEAIYYAFREYFEAVQRVGGEVSYDGRFDELLLLYVRQYYQIQKYYRESQGTRTFTNRHREGAGYIKGME